MIENMKKKLQFSIDFYRELSDQNQDDPVSYKMFVSGQAQAYENILKWILSEEIEHKFQIMSYCQKATL